MITSHLNSVLLEGRLVTDPVVDDIEGLCTLLIASLTVERHGANCAVKRTNYFTVETRGRLAQTCGDLLKEGRGVRIVGQLRQDRWEDDAGNNQSQVVIVAEHVEIKPALKEGVPA